MGRRLSRQALALLLGLGFAASLIGASIAHPLGNFTVNQYARITVSAERATVRYVIDMAEISTLQELQKIERVGDGPPSAAELDPHLQRIAAEYVARLELRVDETRVPLGVIAKTIGLAPGAGGLPTLRVVMDLAGPIPVAAGGSEARRHLSFEDGNRRERLGWREIVVNAAEGVALFDSSAYGNGLTDELKAYPRDMLAAPLREEAASLSFRRGSAPAGAAPLRLRDGHLVPQARDRLAELISAPELTPLAALLGLVLAAGFGAVHAFSPGHGKTIVGAYLVGARADAKHAAFLGLTVTITHTLSVFALGLVTLFASQYILPERLFPILSFISGAIVMAMGFGLFAARLRAARAADRHGHRHAHAHHHTHQNEAVAHSHGGRRHVHLPPGADGGPVGWRGLLTLGISGGLLPCPSALVVLLSAIALHRLGYGMLLVVAFSVGLAATLTGIGLAVIHAGRWMKRPTGRGVERIARVLPIASALVIAVIGAGICYGALREAGLDWFGLGEFVAAGGSHLFGGMLALASAGAMSVLALALIHRLKHRAENRGVAIAATLEGGPADRQDSAAHGSHAHIHADGTRHDHRHDHAVLSYHAHTRAHEHGGSHDHRHDPIADAFAVAARSGDGRLG